MYIPSFTPEYVPILPPNDVIQLFILVNKFGFDTSLHMINNFVLIPDKLPVYGIWTIGDALNYPSEHIDYVPSPLNENDIGWNDPSPLKYKVDWFKVGKINFNGLIVLFGIWLFCNCPDVPSP